MLRVHPQPSGNGSTTRPVPNARLFLMGPGFAGNSQHKGHSTTVLTMDTYCAVLLTMQKAAAAKVGSFLYD